jgi:hypothetical protein
MGFFKRFVSFIVKNTVALELGMASCTSLRLGERKERPLLAETQSTQRKSQTRSIYHGDYEGHEG